MGLCSSHLQEHAAPCLVAVPYPFAGSVTAASFALEEGLETVALTVGEQGFLSAQGGSAGLWLCFVSAGGLSVFLQALWLYFAGTYRDA